MTNYAIFGATSAIAEHTARALVDREASFHLVGRDAAKLETIAKDLAVRGAMKVTTDIVDFSDIGALNASVERATSDMLRIDKALIAFGTLPNQEKTEIDSTYMAEQTTLNFTSPVLLSQAIANHFRERGGGLLAVITSVAGDRGRQSNYLYGSSKGGLSIFLQGLRHKMSQHNGYVLDIRPGFVDTPMTQHLPKGPLWATPDAVGEKIANAIQKNKNGVLYVPYFWTFIMLIIRSVPSAIFHKTKL